MQSIFTYYKVFAAIAVLSLTAPLKANIPSFEIRSENLDKKVWKKTQNPSRFVANDSLSFSFQSEKISSSRKSYIENTINTHMAENFEILQSKKYRLFKYPAHIIDLYNPKKNIQARQILSFNKNQVAIITCIAGKEAFSKELENCHKALTSGAWIGEVTKNKKAAKHWLFD